MLGHFFVSREWRAQSRDSLPLAFFQMFPRPISGDVGAIAQQQSQQIRQAE